MDAVSNQQAIALYQGLGFKRYGTFPDSMKYRDGSYEDTCWRIKNYRNSINTAYFR